MQIQDIEEENENKEIQESFCNVISRFGLRTIYSYWKNSFVKEQK